jgi:hypothetical protein
MAAPRFVWTFHAGRRLRERGLTHEFVERAIRELHPIREANEGEADWRIDAGDFVVLYDYAASGRLRTIRIITVWSKRHRRGAYSNSQQRERKLS